MSDRESVGSIDQLLVTINENRHTSHRLTSSKALGRFSHVLIESMNMKDAVACGPRKRVYVVRSVVSELLQRVICVYDKVWSLDWAA